MFEIYLIYTHLHQQLSECFYRPPEGAQTEQWEWKGEGRQTLKAPISDAASNKNQIWQRWAGATAVQLSGKAFVCLCVCVCVPHTDECTLTVATNAKSQDNLSTNRDRDRDRETNRDTDTDMDRDRDRNRDCLSVVGLHLNL